MNPEQIAQTLLIVQQWANLLPGVFAAGEAGFEAFKAIKSALQARGIEADTALLDQVIADAARRKAHEDEILGG